MPDLGQAICKLADATHGHHIHPLYRSLTYSRPHGFVVVPAGQHAGQRNVTALAALLQHRTYSADAIHADPCTHKQACKEGHVSALGR